MENANSSSVNAGWGQERQKLQNALVKYAANLKSAERENAELRERLEELQRQIAGDGGIPSSAEEISKAKEEIADALIEAKRTQREIIKEAEEKAELLIGDARRAVSEIGKAVEYIASEIKISESRVTGLFRQLNVQVDLLKNACGEK